MSDSGSASLLSTLNFGNGLIEIAALTTLIGSTTAGDLILGNRGAAGLVWGPISAFGASTVIRACASAASPGWLRQMLGLRTLLSDKATGMDLSLALGNKVARRIRGTMDDVGPLGVSCLSDDLDGKSTEKSNRLEQQHTSYRDIYAFDSTTSIILSEIYPTPPESSPAIHTHYEHAFYRPHHFRFQILVLSLSLLKSVEVYILTMQGSITIGILTGVPYLFCLLSGLCLEVNDIVTSRQPVEVDGHLDFVASNSLPTTKQPGGPRKVVLGSSSNPRTGSWWKFFWIVTGTLQTISIVLLYVFLGKEKTQTVFIWAGFQLFWVALRILIFNLTGYAHPMADRPMKYSKLESLPLTMKLRVMNLVLGVGSYQAHVHPRTIEAYLDDSFSTRSIARLLVPGNMCEVYTLRPQLASLSPHTSSPTSSSLSVSSGSSVGLAGTVQVKIIAVIGDTALSSAAWMLGNSEYGAMDLYDSCMIVVLEVSDPSSPSTTLPSVSSERSPSNIVAIPSARVFSARSQWLDLIAAGGEDALDPLFIARGAGSSVYADEKTWIYWVPCEGGQWLQIKSNPAMILDLSILSKTPSASTSTVNSASGLKSGGPRLNHASPPKIHSVLGQQTAEVLDDKQLTRMLGIGRLNISLKSAQEVRGVVEVSRRASNAFVELLR
ncbi:hypothetical protein AAF712_009122 [Marasmius tenuissimus]|uniref:Uncharacterized protein n=1 Tax=Marasmius tenuissimus TaxID=585030 RepID=A0ABR2ZQH8_9AGAR